MRRLLLGLFLLMLLGVGGWVFQGSAVKESSAQDSLVDESTENTGAVQGGDAGGDPSTLSDTQNVHRDDLALAAPPPGSAANLDYHLLVVDATSLKPLPGAEVFLQQDSKWIPLWDREQTMVIPAEAINTTGVGVLGPFVADDQGSVLLPTPGEDDLVLALHEDAIGFRKWGERRGWQDGLLKVYPDPTLRALAVDVDGKPVPGYEIWLFGGSSHLYPRLSAISDADGIARFIAPRFHLENRTKGSFHLGSHGHGRKPDAGPFPFARIPQDTKVVVRSTSTWTIHVQNADGSAFLGSAMVDLESREEAWTSITRLALEKGDSGTLSMPGLAPLSSVTVTGYLQPCGSMVQVEGTTPAAGQVEKLVLRLEEDPYRMTLLLLDEEDQPFSNHDAQISLWLRTQKFYQYQEREYTTDGSGIVEVSFFPFDERRKLALKERLIAAEVFDPEKGLWLRGDHPFHEDELEPGRILTLQLSPKPAFAGGIVLDNLGIPVVGIGVTAMEAGNSGWPDTYGTVETDDEGRFLFQGEPPEKESVLKIWRNGQEVPTVPLNPGFLDHRLEIQARPFEVRGSLLLPPFLSISGWGSSLKFEQGEVSFGLAEQSTQGIVPFDVQVPGDSPGRLILQVEGYGDVVFLEDVVPQPLGSAIDPRLDPWDLRELFSLAEVEVFVGSNAIHGFRLTPVSTGKETRTFERISVATEYGRRFLLLGTSPMQARLTGQSLRPMEVTLKPGKQVLHAQPAIQGTFRLVGDAVVPEEFQLSLGGERRQYADAQSRFHLKANSEWSLEFQEPGQWTCKLYLRLTDGGQRPRSVLVPLGLDGSDTLAFEVLEEQDSFTLEIPLGQDVLDASIEKLRAKIGD